MLEYLPNKTDVLRAREMTSGLSETRFTAGALSYVHLSLPPRTLLVQTPVLMVDVGVCKEDGKSGSTTSKASRLTSIHFCVDISEYDTVLVDGIIQNRMIESLMLSEAVVNSRWFTRTSILLVFNKYDVFRDKVRKVLPPYAMSLPFEESFPEYRGGPDFAKFSKFV
ncbi:guanine nucleotide binding protein, alpha subunit [Lyophyllum atratum]|nr:guanine nucleotide binding protein, alpha subunit [Lyophyllum atratum]